MNRDSLAALLRESTTLSFAQAAEAIGLGLTAARAAYKRDELPYRVIRVGRALRVPSADVERLLVAPHATAAEAAFQSDVAPALADLGATVEAARFNPSTGVLRVTVVLADYGWPRRREVLETITDWQRGFGEAIDVQPVILPAAPHAASTAIDDGDVSFVFETE